MFLEVLLSSLEETKKIRVHVPLENNVTAPPYLDCENILCCRDAGEQEIMKCAKVYLLSVYI